MAGPKIRLHVSQPLAPGQAVALDEGQANYLFSVMRLVPGDGVLLFNGKDGEWHATIAEAHRRRGIALCDAQTAPQVTPPDLWLLFAPLRKERTAFLVEKAVEMGVRRLVPVTTRFTQGERLRLDKERAHATEAAEQCGALYVPDIAEPAALDRTLAAWPADRPLYWADEALSGTPATPWPGTPGTPAALLIGPEGGFAPEEQAALRGVPFVRPVSLGPRILRAETAALAALALWQAQFGDWR